MKLSEIVAELKSLKDTVASFIGDKTKATAEALTSFSSKLSTLETGMAAELASKTGDLAVANEKVIALSGQLEKAQGEVNALGGSLKTACTELNLSVKEGATSGEMITSLKDGVSSTLAKLNVDSKEIPKGKPATSQQVEGKTKTRAEFAQMNPLDQSNFCKAGGKITD
jgi:hypothetical protein